MCDPISLGTALAIGSAVIKTGSDIANYKAQKDASRANRSAALADMRLAQADAGIRQQEELTAAGQQIRVGQRQSRTAQGNARVAASEAGVSGMSVDMLIGDIQRDELEFTHSIEDQSVVTLEQLQRVKQGAKAQADARIASVPEPSLLALGVQLGGTALDLYGNLRMRRPPSEPAPTYVKPSGAPEVTRGGPGFNPDGTSKRIHPHG